MGGDIHTVASWFFGILKVDPEIDLGADIDKVSLLTF
jgi:hypothetical protein